MESWVVGKLRMTPGWQPALPRHPRTRL